MKFSVIPLPNSMVLKNECFHLEGDVSITGDSSDALKEILGGFIESFTKLLVEMKCRRKTGLIARNVRK